MMILLAAKMVMMAMARRGRPRRRQPCVGKCTLAWKAQPRLQVPMVTVVVVVPVTVVAVVVVVKALVTVLHVVVAVVSLVVPVVVIVVTARVVTVVVVVLAAVVNGLIVVVEVLARVLLVVVLRWLIDMTTRTKMPGWWPRSAFQQCLGIAHSSRR